MFDLFRYACNLDDDDSLMTIDENTSRELRGRLERTLENHNELTITVAKIETRFAAMEANIGARMGEIAASLKMLTLVSDDLKDLRHSIEIKRIEHENIKLKELEHQLAIERISEQLKQLAILEQKLKTNSKTIYLIISMLTVIFLSVIAHIFSGK